MAILNMVLECSIITSYMHRDEHNTQKEPERHRIMLQFHFINYKNLEHSPDFAALCNISGLTDSSGFLFSKSLDPMHSSRLPSDDSLLSNSVDAILHAFP